MITCSNCSFENQDGTQKCDNCGQPLLMTQMISQVAAPVPQAIPVLTQIGAIPISGMAVNATRLALVPFDERNGNVETSDKALMVFMPDRGRHQLLGWTYYGDRNDPNNPNKKPSIPDVDLQKMYPWITVDTGRSLDIAVSKRSAILRTNEEGLSFLQVHEDMHTDVWANPYNVDRLFIPAGFEIPIVPGMFVFMGKHQIGVTFIVREI